MTVQKVGGGTEACTARTRVEGHYGLYVRGDGDDRAYSAIKRKSRKAADINMAYQVNTKALKSTSRQTVSATSKHATTAISQPAHQPVVFPALPRSPGDDVSQNGDDRSSLHYGPFAYQI